jgi:ubiquinone biosynthesis monooxygenase Coq7
MATQAKSAKRAKNPSPRKKARKGVTRPRKTAENAFHGDLSAQELIARMIRVDQAGEYGAVSIYEGQLAVLGRRPRSPEAAAIHEMAEAERIHLETFNRLIVERQVRPTMLSPLWRVAGLALGAGTALLGPKAAMACTVAVEEVIEGHYGKQAERLGDDEAELRATIKEYREDEIGHRDTGLAFGARETPAYPLLSAAIKAGSKLAIRLAERI